MKLSQLRQRQSQPTGTASPYNTDDPIVRNIAPYQRPIHALLEGQPVTLIATGDIVGMSPAEKFVDENGRIDWASSNDFVVDDPQVVPQGTEQRQRLQQSHANTRR